MNETVNSINNNFDFENFLNEEFRKEVKKQNFPEKYLQNKAPEEFLNKLEKTEVNNIKDRENIRDYIFSKYKFDIFEFPFIVVYQENEQKTKKLLKNFNKLNEARDFSNYQLKRQINSILIQIMNKEIEYEIYCE